MQCIVTIDTYRCNGCGSCAELCPGVFRLDGDSGRAAVENDRARCSEALDQAAAMCPVACIEVEHPDGG